MTSSALTTREQEKEHPIVALVTSPEAAKYIEPFLPEGANARRAAAQLLLAVKRDETGKLAKCTPESLVQGLSRVLQWRLELGVTAHLVPFKNNKSGKLEATPIADYKGLCELMIASRAVRFVEAREVRQGDQFEYQMGLEPILRHVPSSSRGEKRSRLPITHVYCVVHLPFGRKAFDVMTAADVDEIRQAHSKQWKDGPLPAWYAKKTIIRQVAKTLPKNPELAQFFNVLEQDQDVELDDPAVATVRPLAESDDTPQPAREPGEERDDEFDEFQDDRDLDL